MCEIAIFTSKLEKRLDILLEIMYKMKNRSYLIHIIYLTNCYEITSFHKEITLSCTLREITMVIKLFS